MRKLNPIFTATFIALFFSSCDLDIKKNINLQRSNFFFSTEQFFQNEADRLSNQKGFTKYVNFNGAEEVMKLDTLNFMQEFTPFIKSDINKTIWIDQYACDTIFDNSQIKSISCESLNPKLKTRKLDVQYRYGEPESIDMICMMNKMLLETMEYLHYEKDGYYEVKRIQKLKTGTVDSTLVKVTF